MSTDKPHGALGSNQKLARVPVEEQVKEETTPESSLPPQQPAADKKIEETDVVYLRDDLKPGQAF